MRIAALRRLIRARGLAAVIGRMSQRRLLLALGISGLVLIGALADHVRTTSMAYQAAAAQHGLALMITLEVKQQTRQLLGSLAHARSQDQPAELRVAWPALLEGLAELGSLHAAADDAGLTRLHLALPDMIAATHRLGALIDTQASPLAAVIPELLTLIDAVDTPLHAAVSEIERDGRYLARRSMLELAGELVLFALGFLMLIASSAILVGLLVVAWRRAAVAVVKAQAAEREARVAHQGLDALLEGVPALISTFDLDFRILQANRAVRELFGMGGTTLAGQPFYIKRSAALESDLRQVKSTGLPIETLEHEVVDVTGRLRHLVTSTVPLHDPEGRLFRILRTSLDVTQRREAEQRVQHLAEHDGLTDLPNRLRFNRELEARLTRATPALALHAVDLDGFRSVNDSHGQAVGDELLRAVARRLRGVVRRSDMLARLGGDEFALLQVVATPAEATAMAARITQALAQPYQLGPMLVRCSASLGVAVLIEGEATAESMLNRADLALASARREGIGRFVAFSTEMEGEALDRRKLQGEVALALSRGDLHLDYQPKFSLSDGTLEGVEALLRWHHPMRGVISPGVFVPLAEEAGLALPLARFVLDRAAAQVNLWCAEGHAIPVAVNLSGELIGHGDTMRMIETVLAETGIPPTLLEIEVTESTFIGDSQAARDMLHGLRRMGIRVALDDFGTGFSSLAYLQELPIDVLKVDRCFVAGLGRGEDASARIVDTVVRLAHGLGARVVAEGVETAEQLQTLRLLGCDSVQGYLLARPQRAESIPWLMTNAAAQERLAVAA